MQSILDDPFSTYANTGFSGGAGRAAAPLDVTPAIASTSGPGLSDLAAHPLLSVRNPITWFGALAAVTFGLIAVSSSVRVGKARVTAKVGKG